MSPTASIAAGKRKATLTRDHVIEKILRWESLYGEPPCTADWNPSLARWRAQEIPVPGALPRVIRVLIHYYADEAHEARHVYLGEARSLRADLDSAQ